MIDLSKFGAGGIWRPYFLQGYESVTASATESLTITIGETEEFVASRMRIKATDEGFDIIGITDTSGIPYTNATSTTVIDGRLLTNDTENEYNEIVFDVPLHLPPGTKLRFEITDTSASTNEIWITLFGAIRSVGK